VWQVRHQTKQALIPNGVQDDYPATPTYEIRQTNFLGEGPNRPILNPINIKINLDDWKASSGIYLNLCCEMMTYTKNLLLKCLDSDQEEVAMGEVHVGICGTRQSAPKMK
jgi:hypothetical protein